MNILNIQYKQSKELKHNLREKDIFRSKTSHFIKLVLLGHGFSIFDLTDSCLMTNHLKKYAIIDMWVFVFIV